MHIAVLCSNYPPHVGGLEVVAQSLARALAARHRVTVVTSAWGGRTGVGTEEGLEVHRLPAVHWTEARGVPYPIPIGPGAARAWSAIQDADIFHAHGALYATTLMARAAARRARRPLVLTEHVGFVPYPGVALNLVQRVAWRTIGNAVVAQAAAVAALNQRVVEWLRARYPQKRVLHIGNGVDTDRFAPRDRAEATRTRAAFGLPRDEVLGLFVGRAVAKKNLDVLLEHPRESFRLVTCGAERRGVPDGVIDLGIVPYARMPDLLACVDFMILPSTGEGFPVAAQEAMAAGLPLILRWDEGYAGWLRRDVVAAYDSASDLGPLVRRIARDPDARSRLSVRERSWAMEAWGWAATVSRYEELYAEVRRVSP